MKKLGKNKEKIQIFLSINIITPIGTLQYYF